MRTVRGTQERLYSNERKRGRALVITKEMTGQLKTIGKQKGYTEKSRKQSTAPNLDCWEGRGIWGSRSHNHKVSRAALAPTGWSPGHGISPQFLQAVNQWEIWYDSESSCVTCVTGQHLRRNPFCYSLYLRKL
jgi:hypothetical protein